MSKKPKHVGHENPEMHAALIGLASSGAAGVHLDKRQKRRRTRQAAKRRAVEDSRGHSEDR